MRVVIQRSKEASVTIEGELFSKINKGYVILVGIEDRDSEEDVEYLCQKIVKMRVFDDSEGIPNLSIKEVEDSDILLVSQFTLMAMTKKGNRPSYIHASRPEFAEPLYEKMVARLSELMGRQIKTGKFGYNMNLSLVNDGPHTILIDTQNKE